MVVISQGQGASKGQRQTPTLSGGFHGEGLRPGLLGLCLPACPLAPLKRNRQHLTPKYVKMSWTTTFSVFLYLFLLLVKLLPMSQC